MTEKDIKEVMDAEEETIETFEFTDEEGQDHCFVVESKFKVGKDDYVALLEVDPAIFADEEEECGCEHEHEHEHVHAETCGCGHDHDDEDEDEEPNIILAKVVTDENGETDLQELTDEEFEKAVKVYEALEA
jgi:ABC-type nickel/cobalt efflux system permease component RcnA